MGTLTSWRPSWWSDQVHGSAWERAKEALRRDWSQTKHDLGVGGHEMNQDLENTLKQAAGQEHLPTINQANPPKVIADWNDAEIFYRYGHAARIQYGSAHPVWNEGLEQKLRGEWLAAEGRAEADKAKAWEARKRFVRGGYEFGDTQPEFPVQAVPAAAAATAKTSER